MQTTIKSVYEMYREINIGFNEICQKCHEEAKSKNKDLVGPVPIYHVGNNFEQDEYKILFVSAVPYGWAPKDEFCEITEDDWRNFMSSSVDFPSFINKFKSRVKDLYLGRNCKDSPVFKVIRGVSKELYGHEEEAFEKIAITNFIKCNFDEVDDKLPAEIRALCAHPCKGNYIAIREAEVINPKIIVSLAGKSKYGYFGNDYKGPMKYVEMQYHPSARGIKIDGYIDEVIDKVKIQ